MIKTLLLSMAEEKYAKRHRHHVVRGETLTERSRPLSAFNINCSAAIFMSRSKLSIEKILFY
jgi:hypothetical protein